MAWCHIWFHFCILLNGCHLQYLLLYPVCWTYFKVNFNYSFFNIGIGITSVITIPFSFLSAVVRQDLSPHPSPASPSFLPSTPTISEATAWPQPPLPGWRTNLAFTSLNSSPPAWFPFITRSRSLPHHLRPSTALNLHITLPSLSFSTRSQTLR